MFTCLDCQYYKASTHPLANVYCKDKEYLGTNYICMFFKPKLDKNKETDSLLNKGNDREKE